MKWFGEDWGAPICQITEQVERPAVHCYMCLMPLGENARGIVMPLSGPSDDTIPTIEHEDGSFEVACHYECFYRAILPEGAPTPSMRVPPQGDSLETMDLQSLEKDLQELERTDPVVGEARRQYDETVADILSKGGKDK